MDTAEGAVVSENGTTLTVKASWGCRSGRWGRVRKTVNSLREGLKAAETLRRLERAGPVTAAPVHAPGRDPDCRRDCAVED